MRDDGIVGSYGARPSPVARKCHPGHRRGLRAASCAAQEDPQRAGHGGEGTWRRFLQDWLPPAYEVGTRKYIVPEEGEDGFETDLVVFAPAYPKRLRDREEILGAGVAAAFSVKLTRMRPVFAMALNAPPGSGNR